MRRPCPGRWRELPLPAGREQECAREEDLQRFRRRKHHFSGTAFGRIDREAVKPDPFDPPPIRNHAMATTELFEAGTDEDSVSSAALPPASPAPLPSSAASAAGLPGVPAAGGAAAVRAVPPRAPIPGQNRRALKLLWFDPHPGANERVVLPVQSRSLAGPTTLQRPRRALSRNRSSPRRLRSPEDRVAGDRLLHGPASVPLNGVNRDSMVSP